MHILMTVNTTWNMVNFRTGIVEALVARGDRVTVLSPRDDSVEALQALGAEWMHLEMDNKGLNPISDLKLANRFRKIFKREKPDVVLSYTIKNNIFGAFAARWTGTPFIPNVTGLGTAFLSGGALQKIAETLYRTSFRRLRFVFLQNADDLDQFLKMKLLRPEQARLLPGSGINLDHFKSDDYPEGPVKFLMVARLLRDKGVLEFVEAAKKIRAQHSDVVFQLLGATGADNRSAISAEQVEEWVDAGIVEYLGTTSDVRPFIEAAHCVVLPSYREGAPRTLIEGAAMSRPLIATNVPGCRQVVDEGQSGFLCDVRSADSLAESVLKFLALPRSTQEQMGQEGRSKMEREYDQKIVTEAYLDAIDSLARKDR